MDAPRSRGRLLELAGLFVKLGSVAFGGPAAHIALLETEVVERRRWLERQHFLDLIGATQLIPGPNSTEMVMHVGHERAGWPGLLVAGAGFILPAALITGLFAWFYVRFGSLPAVAPFFAGIQPVIVAVVAAALWRLGHKAWKDSYTLLLGLSVAVAALVGTGEIATLAAAALIGTLWLHTARKGPAPPSPGGASPGNGTPGTRAAVLAGAGAASASSALGATAVATGAPTLVQLALFFLKVGSVLYGSGYVLLAFLEGGLVERWGWLTESQLLDAVAVGQLTPGPVLTTATFVGYLLAGIPGAVVATVAIFLPSFIFVAALNPWVPRLRRSPWTAAFLDAVNAAALGLMLAVTVDLARASIDGWFPALLAIAALVA
ncbi:MAG: chromate efflux transporter, partial [Acidobacteria bacterium]|nr:chromate efflux transporter [Acidobacteriota bacterium]